MPETNKPTSEEAEASVPFSYESVVEQEDGSTVYKNVVMPTANGFRMAVGTLTVQHKKAESVEEQRTEAESSQLPKPEADSPSKEPGGEITLQPPPERETITFSETVTKNTQSKLEVLSEDGINITKGHTAHMGREDDVSKAAESVSETVGISKALPPNYSQTTRATLNLLDGRDASAVVQGDNNPETRDRALYLLLQEALNTGGGDGQQARILIQRIMAAYAAVESANQLTGQGIPVKVGTLRDLYARHAASEFPESLQTEVDNIAETIVNGTALVNWAYQVVKPRYEEAKRYAPSKDFDPTKAMLNAAERRTQLQHARKRK